MKCVTRTFGFAEIERGLFVALNFQHLPVPLNVLIKMGQANVVLRDFRIVPGVSERDGTLVLVNRYFPVACLIGTLAAIEMRLRLGRPERGAAPSEPRPNTCNCSHVIIGVP
jgi:hypothetical protein